MSHQEDTDFPRQGVVTVNQLTAENSVANRKNNPGGTYYPHGQVDSVHDIKQGDVLWMFKNEDVDGIETPEDTGEVQVAFNGIDLSEFDNKPRLLDAHIAYGGIAKTDYVFGSDMQPGDEVSTIYSGTTTIRNTGHERITKGQKIAMRAPSREAFGKNYAVVGGLGIHPQKIPAEIYPVKPGDFSMQLAVIEAMLTTNAPYGIADVDDNEIFPDDAITTHKYNKHQILASTFRSYFPRALAQNTPQERNDRALGMINGYRNYKPSDMQDMNDQQLTQEQRNIAETNVFGYLIINNLKRMMYAMQNVGEVFAIALSDAMPNERVDIFALPGLGKK